MEHEHAGKVPDPGSGRSEEPGAADALRFMRSVIEGTCRRIDPGWPIMVAWGFLMMVGLPVGYFMKRHRLDTWKWPVYLLLLVVGCCVAIYFGARARMRERKAGVVSILSRRIYWVWFILLANGTLWTCLGLFRDHMGGFGFLWTAIYGIALCMMGVLYSREWLYGGTAVFAGMIAACLTEPYAYSILGIVTGLACIIPAIISQRDYRKHEQRDAEA
jgi:hypothetical protein